MDASSSSRRAGPCVRPTIGDHAAATPHPWRLWLPDPTSRGPRRYRTMRTMTRVLGALVSLVLCPLVARAESNWFNPKMGCGAVGAYAKTGKAVDLPGCTGKLPKDAPQAEVALHDLKEIIVDAEEALEKGKIDKIEPLLGQADLALRKAPPTHPELPDRWEQAEK